MTFPLSVDDATKQTIFDWFQYREVCDDLKFNNMFNRILVKSMRKYNQLLRIEPGQLLTFEDGVTRTVNYDWLIQNYREALTANEGSSHSVDEMSGGGTRSIENGGRDVRTIAMTGSDSTERDASNSNTETRNLSDSSSGTTHDETETNNDNKSLGKASPQSVSYAGGGSGMPNNFDWSYPGQQSEDKQVGTSESDGRSSNSASHTGTVGNTGTGSEDIDFTTQRNTTDTLVKGATVDETNSTTEERENTTLNSNNQETQENGRNTDIPTLLQRAKDFILGSSAWDYLYAQIDKCFQGVIMEMY